MEIIIAKNYREQLHKIGQKRCKEWVARFLSVMARARKRSEDNKKRKLTRDR